VTTPICDDTDPDHIHDEDQCCECGGDHCCGYSLCHVNADRQPPYDPIAESLPFHANEQPTGQQRAYHAVVHLLVPCFDQNGNPVVSKTEAEDYISETLRGLFLDWGYVRAIDPETGEAVDGPEGMQTPLELTVCRPYVEGTFGNEDGGEWGEGMDE
jgi:hypothetical protein